MIITLQRCQGTNAARRGNATAEFAILSTVLIPILIGTFEMSRAITVKGVLADAVRVGCRTGSLPGSTNDLVTTDVTNVLKNNNLPWADAIVTIRVNDVDANVSTARPNDKITVMVSLPISKIYPGSTLFLGGNTYLLETCVMVRSG